MFLWVSSVHKQVNKQVNVFTFFSFIRSNQKLQVSKHETYILINSAVTGIIRCQTLVSLYLLYFLFPSTVALEMNSQTHLQHYSM